MSSIALKDCHLAYSVGARTLIGYVDPITGRLLNSEEPFDSVLAEFPDTVIAESWDTTERALEKEYIHPPKRIERAAWLRMFTIQPPQSLVRRGQTESFKVSDLLYGQVAFIYARIGWRFFRLCDRIDMSHDEIVAKCRASEL